MAYKYSRYWCVLVYPENAYALGFSDENQNMYWDKLFGQFPDYGFCPSPLHQPDKECSKPHYHVMIDFFGSTGIKALKDLRTLWGNLLTTKATHDIACVDPYQQYLYLTHSDQKSIKQHKQKFPGYVCETFQGFEIPPDYRGVKVDIRHYIIKGNIKYLSDVLMYCEGKGDEYIEVYDKNRAEFRDLCTSIHTKYTDEYYASRSNRE